MLHLKINCFIILSKVMIRSLKDRKVDVYVQKSRLFYQFVIVFIFIF